MTTVNGVRAGRDTQRNMIVPLGLRDRKPHWHDVQEGQTRDCLLAGKIISDRKAQLVLPGGHRAALKKRTSVVPWALLVTRAGRSIQRFDFDDGSAVVAADPEGDRRRGIVYKNASYVC